MEDQEAIEEMAGIILHEDPDPVVRFRLLRDVLKEPPNTDTLMNTRRELLQSRWVLKLGNEQIEAGSWGRFHSATRTKGKIGTTEAAVEIDYADGT